MSHLAYPLIALLAAVALAGCSTTPSGDPAFPFRELPERDDVLAVSAEVASFIPQAEERYTAYVRIAGGYAERDSTDTAATILDYVRTTTVESEGPRFPPGFHLSLGSAYLDIGRLEKGLDELRTALDLSTGMGSAQAQADIVRTVIARCFEIGEQAFDLLRLAVEQVLVMEDLWNRVELLTATAERYVAAGTEQSANQLIQQAIPAAGNLENPYRRAAAFGKIAEVYLELQSIEQAQNFADRATEELPDGAPQSMTEEELQAVLSMASSYLELERMMAALNLVNRIPEADGRAKGLRRVGEAYARSGTPTTAYILFSQAVRLAEQAENAAQRAGALAEIAGGYSAIDDVQIAVIHANEALRVLDNVEEASIQVQVRRDVLPIYIKAEQLQRVIDLPLPIEEPVLYLTFSADIALQLHEAGFQDASGEVLSATSGRVVSVAGAAPEGLVAISNAYAAVGDVTRALTTAERIGSQYHRAVALAGAGRHSAFAELDEEQLRILESIREELRQTAMAGQ